MTSISPEKFFSGCCFSGKISNYSIFRSSYLMSSFDNMGFVIKDYSTLLRCFSQINTKFSLVIDPSGNHYCGSLSGSNYKKGLNFDKKLNYFTYSDSFQYKGYIRNIEDEVTYFGGLRNKLPNGQGLIVVSSKPVFLGNFINGVPSGRGFYFSKREDLNFYGTFHSKPVFGTFAKNHQYYTGIFSTLNLEEKEINFIANPMTLSNLKECRKLINTFEDFNVKGTCRHFNETIFELKGTIRYSARRLSGHYDISYFKGSRYCGYLQNGNRDGIGHLKSPEGNFQLFGIFNGSSMIKGYLMIDHSGENSAKESHEQNILIPQLVYGNIVYDINGRMHMKGQSKVILTNGALYYGQFINNSITGYGKLYRKDTFGSVYTGQIYYGKQFGVGQLVTKEFVYEGEFRDDLLHGYGKLKHSNYVVRGFWQVGSCLYANIQYLRSKTKICFRSLSILFDKPSNTFDLDQLSGTIELHFDKSSSQTLSDIHEELNKSDEEVKLNQSKVFERRGSLHQNNLLKHQPTSKKRRGSIPQRESSANSAITYAMNAFQSSISKQQSKLKRIASYSRVNESLRIDPSPLTKNLSFKIKSRGNISANKKISKFFGNSHQVQNNSLASSFIADLEDHLENVYCFGGRITEGGKCSGVLKRYTETLAILESDIGFHEGLVYYSNSAKSEELYGSMRDFMVTGIAVKVNLSCKFIGWFHENKPDGVVIKTTFGKEKYIGEYRRGFKHGYGIKRSKTEDGRSVVFLFDYLRGELDSLAKLPDTTASILQMKSYQEIT